MLGLLSLFSFAQQRNIAENVDINQLRKLQMAQLAVSQLYVDSVDQKKLVEDAIKGMLEGLDPHSAYSDAKETKKLNEPLAGNFEGIGVQFNVLDDTLVVMQVIAKGPSEKAGILASDRIVSVDGRPIAGVKMERDSMVTLLRGPKDTKVRLGVVRHGVPETIFFDLVRDKIPLNTLDAAYMIAPGVGYIHLNRFGATSGNEVHEKLVKLKSEGMKSLIFDLQDNGGGYLNAAQDVASEFLEKGKLIVYTEGLNQNRQTLNSTGTGTFLDGKLVILANEQTASAAEIVAGAVQDHDRGTIIGRRTFGKGLVQRPVDLPDGSMIRLTIAHYYTPSGRCVQRPYEKGMKKKYQEDFVNRFTHGELSCIDSIHLDSTKVYYTLNEKRKVYGGGGVMPDIFVPLDTTRYTKFFTKISRRNIITPLVLHYCINNRENLKTKYAKFDDFIGDFRVPQELIDSVISEAKKQKIEPTDTAELEKCHEDLRWYLKTVIAYDVWDQNEYYKLWNTQNDVVNAALRHLRKKK